MSKFGFAALPSPNFDTALSGAGARGRPAANAADQTQCPSAESTELVTYFECYALVGS